jgi:hypothetical protein
MTQMMPPPLPGYPAPAASPPQAPPPAATAPAFVPPAYAPPAPQGYPGPAVAAPAPVLGQPQPGSPFPAYVQPQAAPGGGFGAPAPIDIGAAIADATGGDRDPQPPSGTYRFQIVKTIVTQHPIERKLTLKASLKVLASSNPACPEGAEVSYIEGLTWGAVRVQDFIVNVAGFPSKAAFDAAMAGAGRDPKVELKLLGNAVGNPDVAQPGNHYPPNPFAGRVVDCTVADVTKIAGPKSAKAGQQVTYKNYDWSPAA